MIAPLGLLQHVQIPVLILFARPGRSVDTLQLLVARIPPPIGTGESHQLEHLELAGRRHMGPAAEVNKLPFPIQPDGLTGRDRCNDLRLVVLTDRLKVPDGRIAVPLLAHDRFVFAGQLGHTGFDRRQILGRERPLIRKIIIKPMLDHWPDRHLSIGEE